MKLVLAVLALGMLLVGCGKPKTEFEATKAKAEAGKAWAYYNLGWMYANGEGVEQNSKEAVKW